MAKTPPPPEEKRKPCRKRLILSATSKGGCGKSYTCVQMIEWLLNHPTRPRVKAFDPDFENLTLTNYHRDVTTFVDVDRTNDMDKPLIALCDDVADVAVVDGLGSQQRKTFQGWVDEINLFEIRDSVPGGLDITYVHMVEEDVDILEQAANLLQLVGDKVQWLFVRNLKNAPSTELWTKSMARELAMKFGAKEITMAKLWKEGALLANSERMPLNRAANIEGLFIADKQRFITATRAVNAEFERVATMLLPTPLKE